MEWGMKGEEIITIPAYLFSLSHTKDSAVQFLLKFMLNVSFFYAAYSTKNISYVFYIHTHLIVCKWERKNEEFLLFVKQWSSSSCIYYSLALFLLFLISWNSGFYVQKYVYIGTFHISLRFINNYYYCMYSCVRSLSLSFFCSYEAPCGFKWSESAA